jgi:formiminoglutamase
MEKRSADSLDVVHQKPEMKVWTGRQIAVSLGPQYWYQVVQALELSQLTDWKAADNGKRIVLLGYVCEEGVRRNQGRVGAAAGPLAIRKQLAKVAWHAQNIQIFDAGDVICTNESLEQAQDLLAKTIRTLLRHNLLPIVLGGGHDIAYGHGKGIWKSLSKGRRLGIINFDAHFDLRPVESAPNSGTPFNQLIQEMRAEGQVVDYFSIGIQAAANTPELFAIAAALKVDFIPIEDCQWRYLPAVLERIQLFLDQVDDLYLSIDLDGFAAAFAPGVSAPSPMGLTPDFTLALLEPILASQKIIGIDFAELNPRFDLDGLTAKLAARLIDFMVRKLS